MGMKENWKLFVESTKAKAESHEKVAEFWDKFHNYISLALILLSAITTVLAVLKGVPKLVVVGVSGMTTLLSAVAGFMQPSQKRQLQANSAKEFRSLMLRMIRCETDREYEELWKEYNKEILSEPFLPMKYRVAVQQEYSMTPELTILIDQKEDMVEEALAESDDDEKKGGYNGTDTIPNEGNAFSEDTKLMKRDKGYGSVDNP